MGERRNIALKYHDNNTIYFYTHWEGKELEQTLKTALQRSKERWCDESYLARIIFSDMIKDEINELTSYGIAPYETDPQYETIKVDLKEQTVNGASFENYIK